jgi:hypothetical protein
MPVLNPPSSPQKILVEVPLPQPVGGTTPSQPTASPTPAPAPRPKKPKPDPFKQIKGPPVMILPHSMDKQGAEKMRRAGQPVKFAADRETLASLARGVQDSLFHGIDHAITPTRILADYLNDHGHDNLAAHLREVADKLGATAGQDHPDVWITRGPATKIASSVQHRTFRDGDRIIRRTLIPTGASTLSFATIHSGPLPQHIRESVDDAAYEADRVNGVVRQPVQMGRYRAPTGGIIVRGQFYPGGKMLPKEATEANPQPNKKTDAKANRKKKKKKKRKKKAVWPSYPMGYRGPIDDDDEGGDGGGGGEAMRRKGRPSKFAADPSASMYPEGTPAVHSVEVKDRKKFGDTLFNKHQGKPVPLDPESKLAKLYDPHSHNLVAFKDADTGEHFLHGRLSEAGGKVHLNTTPMKDEWQKAYDWGYQGYDMNPGAEGTVEHHLHRLGVSDSNQFRPHGHSIRIQPDPKVDLQDGWVDEYMRHGHGFFGEIGKYDPNGRINAGESLRSIFNDHLKRGEEKPFTELANHAAQALQTEHEDPEDGISQHFNTAKKMNEEVGKGNPANDPDLEPTAWKDHIQAMIDKHLPESWWATKKQGQGKEKMRRRVVKMMAKKAEVSPHDLTWKYRLWDHTKGRPNSPEAFHSDHNSLADALQAKSDHFKKTGSIVNLSAIFPDGSARPVAEHGGWYYKANGQRVNDYLADRNHRSKTGTTHAYLAKDSPRFRSLGSVKDAVADLTPNSFGQIENASDEAKDDIEKFTSQALESESHVPLVVLADYLEEKHPELDQVISHLHGLREKATRNGWI